MKRSNEHPILFSTSMVRAILEGRKIMTRRVSSGDCRAAGSNCKYGKPGDLLWVKETFRQYRHAVDVDLGIVGIGPVITEYRADGNVNRGGVKWKPSIFMPKAAARIWLEITDIRCERLQEISEQDVISEGVMYLGPGRPFPFSTNESTFWSTAQLAFEHIWETINGPDSWEQNPWVWIITFKKIDK